MRTEFNLDGPLLQDTRENRAMRVRAPDVRLRSSVGPSAAWLGAELCDVPEEMMQGEVVEASLELINRGLVALHGTPHL